MGQVKPHWRMMTVFVVLIAVAAFLDSLFTYMSKILIDEGIVAGDRDAVTRIIAIYGSLCVVQAITVFGFIYMTGLLGERVRYDLRKTMFAHLQKLSLSY